jgi:hypothetical protein
MNKSISKMLLASLVVLCSGAGNTLSTFAYSADQMDDCSQANQLATEAARTCAQRIKPSYKTLSNFIADYDSGKNQLDATLTKIGANYSDQSLNTPILDFNNQTRLQYRDSLLNQMASYNNSINQLVNHYNFDAKVQARLPAIQARLNSIKAMMTPPAWAQAMGQRGFAKGIEMQNSPEVALNKAKQTVIDSDNEQAAQLQALRDKLQQKIEALAADQQKIQDEVLEMKANAATTYSEYVGHRVMALTNTSSELRGSAVGFVNREQMDDRMKLLDLHTTIARHDAERQARLEALNAAPAYDGSQRGVPVTAGLQPYVGYGPGPALVQPSSMLSPYPIQTAPMAPMMQMAPPSLPAPFPSPYGGTWWR